MNFVKRQCKSYGFGERSSAIREKVDQKLVTFWIVGQPDAKHIR